MTRVEATPSDACGDEERTQPFVGVERLTNHWARPVGPRSYYWFLTFQDQPGLRELAQRCQASINLPYYDLTAPDDLHMTLERIAFEGEISQQQLAAIQEAATKVCSDIAPLRLTVGGLGGTSGAIGFSVYPGQPIGDLRDRLRTATLTAFSSARLRPASFHPHITIAYSNTADLPAEPIVAAVKALSRHATVVTVIDVSLVLLERRPRAYTWQTISRMPLMGGTTQRASH